MGGYLVFRELDPETKDDVLICSIADQSIQPILNSRFSERDPTVSPDSKWIAYRSNEAGQQEVYCPVVPESGGEVQDLGESSRTLPDIACAEAALESEPGRAGLLGCGRTDFDDRTHSDDALRSRWASRARCSSCLRATLRTSPSTTSASSFS